MVSAFVSCWVSLLISTTTATYGNVQCITKLGCNSNFILILYSDHNPKSSPNPNPDPNPNLDPNPYPNPNPDPNPNMLTLTTRNVQAHAVLWLHKEPSDESWAGALEQG